uniref:Uncharacterized protein n=1 Tax=Hanusia phi TaxID=3032 RepID=A0A7S0DVR5_9CRYP
MLICSESSSSQPADAYTPCRSRAYAEEGAWKPVKDGDIQGAVRWISANRHLRPFCGCGSVIPCPTSEEDAKIVRDVWRRVCKNAVQKVCSQSYSSDLKASCVELLARVLHVAEYEALTTHNLHGIQADISEFAQEMDAVPKLTEYLFDNNDDQLSFSLCLLLRVAPPEALRRLFSKDVVLKGMRHASRQIATAHSSCQEERADLTPACMLIRSLVKDPDCRHYLHSLPETENMVCTLLQTFADMASRLEEKEATKASRSGANARNKELAAGLVDLLEGLSDLLVYRVIWPDFELGNWNKSMRGVVFCLSSENVLLRKAASNFLSSFSSAMDGGQLSSASLAPGCGRDVISHQDVAIRLSLQMQRLKEKHREDVDELERSHSAIEATLTAHIASIRSKYLDAERQISIHQRKLSDGQSELEAMKEDLEDTQLKLSTCEKRKDEVEEQLANVEHPLLDLS